MQHRHRKGWGDFDDEIAALVSMTDKPKVVDIGPGTGHLSQLVRQFTSTIDAVEIHEPYLKEYNLLDKYDTVYVADALEWARETEEQYDIALLVDVLEHFEVEDAQRLLWNLQAIATKVIVVVPWTYPQDEVDGNPYEEHLQPDLTVALMAERYTSLVCLRAKQRMGLYCQQSSVSTSTGKGGEQDEQS